MGAINYEDYLHHLDGYDLPKRNQIELISIVHHILMAQLDLATGEHPIQTCGYDQGSDSRIPANDQYSSLEAFKEASLLQQHNAKETK